MIGIGTKAKDFIFDRLHRGGAYFLLRDNFTTPLTAGNVDGTAAEPGPGTRTATAANVEITGGAIVATGTGVWGEASWNEGPITRSAGVVLVQHLTFDSLSSNQVSGWRRDNAFGYSGHDNLGWRAFIGSALYLRRSSDGTSIPVASLSAGVEYPMAQLLRSTGNFSFVKISGNWMLLYIDTLSSATPLYFGVAQLSLTTSGNKAQVAQLSWLPAPLTSDGFGSTFGTSDGLGHAETSGIGSGGAGKVWTGATWANAAGKASNTPGVGSELVTNGDMETGDPPSSWTTVGATASQVADERTGGGGSSSMNIAYSASAQYTHQTVVNAIGSWHILSYWQKKQSGTQSIVFLGVRQTAAAGTYSFFDIAVPVSGTWSEKVVAYRALTTDPSLFFRSPAGATDENFRFDDVSVKTLTLSSLFASTTHSTADVLVTAALTLTSGTQAGVVVNLDSASSPANFVIAYHDGTNCKLEKCVAGTYTTVISAAASYSAGAELRVIKDGTAYRLYYNNALVGTGTISDAGIVNNTLHGLFSTYASNTLDNFTVYARGTSGEYDAPLNEVANG